MGLRKAFKKLWRFFHPQYTAMSQKEISNMDRAVSESMAKGSFGTRPSTAPMPMTGDQLWSLDLDLDTDLDTVPPINNDRLCSMSSHRSAGRLSIVSSRRRDSGYGDQLRPPSRRQMYSSQYAQQYPPDPYPQDQYDPYQGYEQEEQYQQEQYPSYQYSPYPYPQYHQQTGSPRTQSRVSYVPSDAPYDMLPGQSTNMQF